MAAYIMLTTEPDILTIRSLFTDVIIIEIKTSAVPIYPNASSEIIGQFSIINSIQISIVYSF